MSAPVKPVAPSRTTSRSRCAGSREDGMCRLSHSRNRGLDPAVRSADSADQGGRSRYFQIDSRRSSHAPAPPPSPAPSPAASSRSPRWSASAPPSSPARRTAAPTTPGPAVAGARGPTPRRRRTPARDLTPAGVLRRPAGVVRRARPGPGRPLRVGRQPQHRLRLRRGARRGVADAGRAAADRRSRGARPGPLHERRDRHQRAGGRRRRAGRRQDRRPHAVPGPGRRPGHLRRERCRGRAARLARPARGDGRGQHRDPAVRRHRGRALAPGAPTATATGRPPSW